MWIHRIAGSLIMIVNIVFISILINKRGGRIEKNVHSILGVIILAFVIAIALAGVFTRSRMNRIQWNTILILRIKFMHKVR